MSLNKISSISLLAILSFVGYTHCWVFTDIDFTKLQKAMAEEDIENELTDEDLASLKISLIYPGTKWCGSGNVADSYDDLGWARETDKCCRAHDNCPDVIAAGETKMNLTNSAFYSRLSCKCDMTFRQCLHDANSRVASQIGTVYFNALGTKCYRKDYPVTGCQKRGGWFNRKCLEYTYDREGEETYQWFHVPNY